MTDDLFIVWELDDIDTSDFDDTTEPRPLYVALLCCDCEPGQANVVRGYDPSDGIFERPGQIVAVLGGVALDGAADPYAGEIESELRAEFEARRESNIYRSNN